MFSPLQIVNFPMQRLIFFFQSLFEKCDGGFYIFGICCTGAWGVPGHSWDGVREWLAAVPGDSCLGSYPEESTGAGGCYGFHL